MSHRSVCRSDDAAGAARSGLHELFDLIAGWLSLDPPEAKSFKNERLMPFDTAPSSFKRRTPPK